MDAATYAVQPAVDANAALLDRQALVLQHLPQVRLIARRIHGQLPDSVGLDDLISTGVVGLLAAIDNFDPSLDVQLKTYAERKIRGAILDGLRETDWAPREVRKKSKLIQAAIDRARQCAGREAAEEEIAAELGIEPAEYQKWLTEVRSVELERLEYAGGEEPARRLLQSVPDDAESWNSPGAKKPAAIGLNMSPAAKNPLRRASWNAPNWSAFWAWPSTGSLRSSAPFCISITSRK